MKKIVIIIIVLTWSQLSWAHGVKLFANLRANQVHGMAYFVGGSAAANCQIKLLDSAGQEIAGTTTDSQGNFIMQLPPDLQGDFKLLLLAGPGHSATLPLLLDPKQTEDYAINLESIENTQPEQNSQLELQLASIQQQLLQLQSANSGITFEKVVAGIGYIAGLLGLAAYVHYRQRLKQLNEKNN